MRHDENGVLPRRSVNDVLSTPTARLHDIRVAAIDVGNRTIWINPTAGLNDAECLFVLTHEIVARRA